LFSPKTSGRALRISVARASGEASSVELTRFGYVCDMRATLLYGAGDVRVETVPDAHLIEATDALVRVRQAAICGSDLWTYKSMEPTESGRRMGHEFIGVVEDVGSDVNSIKGGDLVVSPFLWSDGTCVFDRALRGRRARPVDAPPRSCAGAPTWRPACAKIARGGLAAALAFLHAGQKSSAASSKL